MGVDGDIGPYGVLRGTGVEDAAPYRTPPPAGVVFLGLAKKKMGWIAPGIPGTPGWSTETAAVKK